jgi:hypothetical protein
MVPLTSDTVASPFVLSSFRSFLFRNQQQYRVIQNALSQISERKNFCNRQLFIHGFKNNVVAQNN